LPLLEVTFIVKTHMEISFILNQTTVLRVPLGIRHATLQMKSQLQLHVQSL